MAQVEELSYKNLEAITDLAMELWPDAKRNDELEFYFNAVMKPSYTAYLIKNEFEYFGFILLSLRTDYVEGTYCSPVCYIEGIYIKKSFRRCRLASELIQSAVRWGLINGCMEMASDTDIDNTLSIDFHKSLGFKEVNRVVCFSRQLSMLKDDS